MADRIWLGGIYLKEEGGYKIILKSLNHYKKRLSTLSESPELKGAAGMFASVLQQQAAKTMPEIDGVSSRILECLGGGVSGGERHSNDNDGLGGLAGDVPFMEKALACYKSDITKAQDTGYEYFVRLVGDMEAATEDKDEIERALQNIGVFEGGGRQAAEIRE
ncbi:MAG: hypothetical protein J4F28_07190 [Nitrosopumilaceae archaeon]|nr:hypothetical protein [Nitrosopumilaceae archaeon]